MRISVALCTHNGARFVGEQVASILSQARLPDELVLSDDASADGTVAIVAGAVRAAGGGAPELTVIENPVALGVVRNFEQAIQAATGDLIALCDQDDVWERDRLEALAQRFEADPGLLCVFTDATIIDGDGAPTGATLFQSLELRADELDAVRDGRGFGALLRRNLATGATMVFRRSLLEAAAPFPDEWVHDEWLAIVAAARGGLAVVESRPTRYRIHGANAIGVIEPTLRYKLGRMLEPRGERNRTLARRGAVLAERLPAMGAATDLVTEARRKAVFESRRARMPRNRLLRAVPVLLLATTGAYARYASRGLQDIARDLVQPA
ncbi:glycosyltransferase family 2 protein [Leifsonia sp. P73]|uniref:glycosyltransferase family 2 protein n=1 Tax=Leifsonia sp. P73 TaxID=3423959 RepID=UPI003DA32689